MRRLLKDRRRAQAGTTLIELLVSLVIIGLALALVIGVFSTGLLDATIAKRNTAVEAVLQYELDRVSGSSYDSSPSPYSECFAVDNPTAPLALPAYQGQCPAAFSLRADVNVALGPTATSETWTVSIVASPDWTKVGSPTSIVKVNR